MTSPLHKRAVYFLGNDKVLNFGLAAFESFRNTNPELPAFLLPFNQELSEMRSVCAHYRISIIEDPLLADFKAMEESFWDEQHRDHAMAHKFFVYNGPAETFLFSDCDVVFLEKLDHLFDQFDHAKLDFLSFEPSLDYVYHKGSLRDELLSSNTTRGFNAGVFMSRTGLITAAQIIDFFGKSREARPHFSDRRDQSLMNYLVDSHKWRHMNLAELDASYSDTNNARHRPLRQTPEGYWVIANKFSSKNNKRIAMLHWNGLKLPGVLPNMRHFLKFRLKTIPKTGRAGYLLANAWAGKAKLWRRFSNFCSTTLHRIFKRFSRNHAKG